MKLIKVVNLVHAVALDKMRQLGFDGAIDDAEKIEFEELEGGFLVSWHKDGEKAQMRIEQAEISELFVIDVEEGPDRYSRDSCYVWTVSLGSDILDSGEEYDESDARAAAEQAVKALTGDL